MSRRWAGTSAFAVALGLVGIGVAGPPDAARASHARALLPDLVMDRPERLQVVTTDGGRERLRFDSIVINIGEGPLELEGTRTGPDGSFEVVQNIYSSAPDYGEEAPVDSGLIYGGDGHDHWHVPDVAVYEMALQRDGANVGHGAKIGFCFFDNVAVDRSLPGAPQGPYYEEESCGGAGSDFVGMGLSPGWGDRYQRSLPGQYIDITGLDAGRYRLLVRANGGDRLYESDTTNNSTWVEIRLKRGRGGPSVEIVERGPRP